MYSGDRSINDNHCKPSFITTAHPDCPFAAHANLPIAACWISLPCGMNVSFSGIKEWVCSNKTFREIYSNGFLNVSGSSIVLKALCCHSLTDQHPELMYAMLSLRMRQDVIPGNVVVYPWEPKKYRVSLNSRLNFYFSFSFSITFLKSSVHRKALHCSLTVSVSYDVIHSTQ